MNVQQFIQNDKHILCRRLRYLAYQVEEISHIEMPDPQTIILEGNTFDVITAIHNFRRQYIMLGLGWNVMELTLDSKNPYIARLSYNVAKEKTDNQLNFKIKVKDYGKEN